MYSLPPSPGFPGARLAKNEEVIKFRIAREDTRSPFEVVQNGFQAHDIGRLAVTLLAQAGGEEGVGESALIRGHLLDRQSLPRLWDVMPVAALVTFEVERRLGLLLRIQRGQESRGTHRHVHLR